VYFLSFVVFEALVLVPPSPQGAMNYSMYALDNQLIYQTEINGFFPASKVTTA
jgi:hypothetical protein